MFDKNDYFNLRDTAWQFILKNNIRKLPIDLELIAQKNGWILKAVDENIIQGKQAELIAEEVYGINIILYSNSIPLPQARFRIAHEFGHIVLRHFELDYKELEKEANMFAARLLMPLCVLKELNVTHPSQIEELCLVGTEPAKYRFSRLLEKKAYKRFYTSPLEVQVLGMFEKFIKDYKRRK